MTLQRWIRWGQGQVHEVTRAYPPEERKRALAALAGTALAMLESVNKEAPAADVEKSAREWILSLGDQLEVEWPSQSAEPESVHTPNKNTTKPAHEWLE